FKLYRKGYIKEGYDADLLILERVSTYSINPNQFKSKAKYSPFNNFKTQIKIWKVFLRGIEINNELNEPTGKILIRIK
ncbi:MAG: dihydroorotase, partial [Candidatus Hermodarchaeota archaeon]